MPLTEAPTIVLAIDGLRAAALGAYGQTGYETPAFDALTAESTAYDACYASSPDPQDLYRRLAEELGGEFTLVTDDREATARLSEVAQRVVEIEPLAPASVADSVEDTATGVSWMQFAAQVVELAETDFPGLLWVHTRGLYGPWDAPESLHSSLVDEDDPEVLAGVEPPDEEFSDPATDDACDARFAAGCRYAGQVQTLDACLGGWLDVLQGLFEGEDYRLIVLGLRGFPLGEHGRVGGVDHRLFSEQQRVPLLVRDADGESRFAREPALTNLRDALLALLAGGAGVDRNVRLCSDQARALVTEDWLLRCPTSGEPELYVKPDDRWEQNDIAIRKEFVVEELLAEIAGESGVAEPRAAD